MASRASYLAIGSVAIVIGSIAVRRLKKKVKVANSATSTSQTKSEDTFESHVCKHDGNGLVALCPSTLWHVTAKFKGNGPPWRRMIIYRPSGTQSLILLSPTAVPEDVMAAIDKLGAVSILLVPNSYHRTDVAVFKQRYPEAKVACPPGWVRKAVSEVVEVDMDARELTATFQDAVKVIRIGGLCNPNESEGDFEYGYEFRLSNETWAYAVTDTLFNCPEKGFLNWALCTRGLEHPDGHRTPRVGRISKLFMNSRANCAEFYRGMGQRDDVSMILLAHGDNLVGAGVKQAFLDVAADLDTR
mmetsp:Transcript_17657/g.30435  ORF Transcript_17657/g.30435 Transcript_17657/m.30435 type:complete len:301 (-) Transcript_17657:195-1097(-)|eukprot:CAMPEP_0183782740 /NCGR_PEP_ID=MMETSP0739-20130205/61741_1 /TAXON_ID=385413 /ORGANISM="Thalassiosira miniscula, Strain CCMP1093" /LENGTH=300 /DNA_ID=CAMNT_0026026249 /DNA_START=38 /DNA_END=940 /DNA_ORIENTATION=-